MTNLTPQDVAACIVAVAIIIGLIILAVLERQVPDALNIASGSAITWLFVRSAQVAERVPPHSPN